MISIAIDGPAGAGKSKITTSLAKELGWNYLDTGALYRAITVELMEQNVDLKNPKLIAESVKNINIDVKYEQEIDLKAQPTLSYYNKPKTVVQHTYANGKDVTSKLRTPEVSSNSALVSPIPEVRARVKSLQRTLAEKENIIIEGRDIGTEILPETKNKFYLDASVEIRAKRRAKQLQDAGEKVDINLLKKQIEERDFLDKTREISPLKVPEDAIYIDTSDLTINQVLESIKANLILENPKITTKKSVLKNPTKPRNSEKTL